MMKTIKLIFILIFVLTFSFAIGQSQKELDREKNKVEILTVEERANLQMLFYNKMKKMKLTDEVEEEYYRYLLHYVYDMQRLNDKDKDYTDEEMKEELGKLVTKMDTRIEPILTEEQFKMHKKNWNDIMKVVYFKNGWKWNEE
ncbi:hypothetical protein [Winogradskyella sp. PG-2]|uniref:hypothetical protein n=1 Tax=Winogradskyella sp. PG-2 TaxID=754409 RepID=UPI0005EF8528|nr:hypothetical protein [Winogradskyella sp. PG-2]